MPKGVELEKPLYVQVTSNGGSLYWRMVVVAEEGARFTLIEDLSSAAADTVAYTNAVVELFVEPAAKIEYVSLQNLSQETWHFGRHKAWLERDSELDWVIGGFGSKRGKVWIENDLAGPGRDVARHRRVLRRRRPAPRLRHLPGAHRAEHRERLRVQGRAARERDARCGAG